MASTRRNFAKNVVAATAAFSLPAFVKAGTRKKDKKLKIVCVGGHPDDPESGCGGTLALLAAEGHVGRVHPGSAEISERFFQAVA